MKNSLQIASVFWIICILFSCGIKKSINHQPQTAGYDPTVPVIIKHSDTLLSSGNNYLIKNAQKQWELYVNGDPLQRGLVTGGLTQDLFQKQEAAFFSIVQDFIPSKGKQRFLRGFLKFYNRKMYLNIPEEYQTEIYGLSQYAGETYDYIAPKYLRSLYLHGAHDIGHALQDLMLVGCSSMAVWGDQSEDSSLIIGRNFDFYAGDDFAKEKIISFVRPTSGHPYMSVSWGGMIGVVSGMNYEGLTVTINAGKSKIPLKATTPISILVREILQYASTIDEAIAIAHKRKVFVSESIMVGSAKDKKAVLIEVSPKSFGVYDVPNNSTLICSNHFQSTPYLSDKRNITQFNESHSQYRYQRMQELISQHEKMNPEKMVEILRNKEGLQDVKIGYGNEKALNQLLAHHSIVFKPEQRLVWVSSNPYQLGEYTAYDLWGIFGKQDTNFVLLETNSLNIPKDDFVNSKALKDYENYRIQDKIIWQAIKKNELLSPAFISEYQSLNPDLWNVYFTAGAYYYTQKEYKRAEIEFEKALSKEITTVPDRKNVEQYLRKTKRKNKK